MSTCYCKVIRGDGLLTVFPKGFCFWNGLCLGIRRQQKPITNLIMAFDATLPANNSLVSSAELRGQFTSLKTLVDDCPTTPTMQDYVLNAILSDAATNISGLEDLSGPSISDPPTQAEVQTVVGKINELIAALQAH